MADKKRRITPSGQNIAALKNMHSLFLQALRHREQEIFRYLAILGPALGGFLWLLQRDVGERIFVVGTLSVISLLLLGALYSLALGYNYRYVTFELAKLESILKIKDAMLVSWPRAPKHFLERYKLFCCIPWCTPPEIIKVFWGAFLLGIVGVIVTICYYSKLSLLSILSNLIKLDMTKLSLMISFGLICIAIGGIILPIHYGCKLLKTFKAERKNWRS
jgi:hypothetical protein